MPSNSPTTPHNTHTMATAVVLAAACAHFLNDLAQAVMLAVYPMFKESFALSFTQIGLITLIYQITASFLQPCVGWATDRSPKPFLLPLCMVITLIGILALAIAPNFAILLIASALIGLGSSIFHPEASRVARMASGGQFGTAQSAFQVGGNSGSAIGPVFAALCIVPSGQWAIGLTAIFALMGFLILYKVTGWVIKEGQQRLKQINTKKAYDLPLTKTQLYQAVGVILVLLLAKFIYIASISNYFTFYLIEKFNLSLTTAQLYLFVFLASVALGTFVGGPIGDKIGRKVVIIFSFVGMLPFALLLPHVHLTGTIICAIMAGLILSSAFSAMVVYAQEAMPNQIGMITGLMFGVMFGISGVAAAGLGVMADHWGVASVFYGCAFCPAFGVLAFFLPNKTFNHQPN